MSKNDFDKEYRLVIRLDRPKVRFLKPGKVFGTSKYSRKQKHKVDYRLCLIEESEE